MSGIQKACLFLLSASAAAGGTYLVFAGGRSSGGAEHGSAGGWADPAPSSSAAMLQGGSGSGAPESGGFRSAGSIADLDPAVVADLRREGIDLGAIDEFRSLLRDAVTPGDALEKMKRLLALRDRLARANAADPESWTSGFRATYAVVEHAGRTAVTGVVDSVTGLWDRLIHEVDL